MTYSHVVVVAMVTLLEAAFASLDIFANLLITETLFENAVVLFSLLYLYVN